MSAEQTMIDNLFKNTGQTLDQWIELLRNQNLDKHGEMMKFLKETHGLTHGFANMITHKARKSDAGSVDNVNDLVHAQYLGKEHFKPIYDHLISSIQAFGDDVEIAPKNAYVSLRRKKQFAILQPATKTRFEIGLNLKGEDTQGKLEVSKNAMCSHVIKLTDLKDLDDEKLAWIKTAYKGAG